MKLRNLALVLGAFAFAACDPMEVRDQPMVVPDDIGQIESNPAEDLEIVILGLPINNRELDEVKRLIATGEDFSFGGQEFNGVNTGFGAPLVRSLSGGGIDGRVDAAAFAKKKGDKRCAKAKAEKIAWHQQQGTGIPPAFGKFTFMKLSHTNNNFGEQWFGPMHLCTWIENGDTYDEYFWEIELVDDGPINTARTYKQPFDGTLNLAGLIDTAMVRQMMAMWEYKIHAKEKAVQIKKVWRNGQRVSRRSEPNIYVADHNCFDMFLDGVQLDELRQNGTLDFTNQGGYCMGRCDGLIMNTK